MSLSFSFPRPCKNIQYKSFKQEYENSENFSNTLKFLCDNTTESTGLVDRRALLFDRLRMIIVTVPGRSAGPADRLRLNKVTMPGRSARPADRLTKCDKEVLIYGVRSAANALRSAGKLMHRNLSL
ncbi:hypothetical protein HanIR_Chr06g0281171 [Helianthus annuus]|nr:hypothetical protein HanIR_Chr06g0281171 [Helianthus annuus]